LIDSEVGLWFMPLLGISNLDVGASAAAVAAAGATASCSFCSLHPTGKHTLLLKNESSLRVDGDIIVNSNDGNAKVGEPNWPCGKLQNWHVCGDGFDIFSSNKPEDGIPPYWISAKSISSVGGWETHQQNVVVSDASVWPDYATNPPTVKGCSAQSGSGAISPDPPSQAQKSNVCIHVPKITDPLVDIVPTPLASNLAVPDPDNCPLGTHFPTGRGGLTIADENAAICPGLYRGGIRIDGLIPATTTMLPGFYYMLEKGFVVEESASVDGTSGVTIYSSGSAGSRKVRIKPDPDLAAPLNPNRLNPDITIESSKYEAGVGKRVTYTANVEASDGGLRLDGTISFHDGTPAIATCTPRRISGVAKITVKCEVKYTATQVGAHGISVVFLSSDTCSSASCYNNAEAVLTPEQSVVSKSVNSSDIALLTSGNVQLSGQNSGRYQGIVMFQDREGGGDIKLSYGSGLATTCSPTTPITVRGLTGPEWALQQDNLPPQPCGVLGGIEGTICAPDEDSDVHTTISGLANVQIIAGTMKINSSSTTRFAYDGELFAGSSGFALFE
jgi:hypothetical protein